MAWACFLFLKTLIAGRFYLCFTPLNRDNRSLGCVPNWQVVVEKEELREEVVCELLEFQTIFSIKTTFRPIAGSVLLQRIEPMITEPGSPTPTTKVQHCFTRPSK